MADNLVSYEEVWRLAALRSAGDRILIGIDGAGGSGKTDFAYLLACAMGGGARVVEMDDFYREPDWGGEREAGWMFDWRRLRRQVLNPAVHNEPTSYQRFDWVTQRMADWIDVPNDVPLVVEGVTTLRRELRGIFTLRIWVETPQSIRLARGLARDGASARRQWEEVWMPAEDYYRVTHRPEWDVDVFVDGTLRADVDLASFCALAVPMLGFGRACVPWRTELPVGWMWPSSSGRRSRHRKPSGGPTVVAAAHRPHTGQGAAQAITDAVALGRALGAESNVPDALAAYERERRPKTAHLLGRGRRTARIIRTTNPVACSFREVAVRLAPVTLLVKLFASLNQRSGTDVSRGGRSA